MNTTKASIFILLLFTVCKAADREFSLMLCSDIEDDKDIMRNPLLLYTQWFQSLFCVFISNSDYSLDELELLSSGEASTRANSYLDTFIDKTNSRTAAASEIVNNENNPFLMQRLGANFTLPEGQGFTLDSLTAYKIPLFEQVAFKSFYDKPLALTDFCKTGTPADIAYYDDLKILEFTNTTSYVDFGAKNYYEIDNNVIGTLQATKPAVATTSSKQNVADPAENRCSNYVSMIEVEYIVDSITQKLTSTLSIYYQKQTDFQNNDFELKFYYSISPQISTKNDILSSNGLVGYKFEDRVLHATFDEDGTLPAIFDLPFPNLRFRKSNRECLGSLDNYSQVIDVLKFGKTELLGCYTTVPANGQRPANLAIFGTFLSFF